MRSTGLQAPHYVVFSAVLCLWYLTNTIHITLNLSGLSWVFKSIAWIECVLWELYYTYRLWKPQLDSYLKLLKYSKVFLTQLRRYVGRAELQLHSFLTSALDGGVLKDDTRNSLHRHYGRNSLNIWEISGVYSVERVITWYKQITNWKWSKSH